MERLEKAAGKRNDSVSEAVSVILEKQRQGRGGEREERPGPGGNC
jgi:hypothetical protein